MIDLKNVNDIEVIIRNMLITQSELNEQFVRNSLSLYGTGLNEEVAEDIFDSITDNNCLVLFELNVKNGNFDISETIKDVIKIYKTYNVHIIIYGNNSNTLANILAARIRSEKVRMTLEEQGVYLEFVDEVQSVHEFKNDVLWLRTDFDMQIACEMSIKQVGENDTFDSISKLTLLNV